MNPEIHLLPQSGNTLLKNAPLPEVLQEQINESPLLIDSDQDNSPGSFSAEPVEADAEYATSSESEASKEKDAKIRKLGILVTSASVRLGKVFNKAMVNLAASSVLAPGSAMLYVEHFSEKDSENEASAELVMSGEIARLFEAQGYIKEAPSFREQVSDTSRTNKFRYSKTNSRNHNDHADPKATVEMTEHSGLVDLQKFLKDFVKFAGRDKRHADKKATARSMLESLTFIGGKEYEEAAKGLGDYWKAYLDADPERQICLTTRISSKRARKSDMYLAETIMSGFSDEELDRYSGRFITEVDDITAKPENTKIVLLDDWTISGIQMRGAYSMVSQSDRFNAYADSVEINLITSSAGRLDNRFEVTAWNSTEPTSVPVKAYYRAHDAIAKTVYPHNAHISGTHSSVDYDFETDLQDMVLEMEPGGGFEKPEDKRIKMPPLTNILRTYYKSTPTVEIQKDRIVRKDMQSTQANTIA